MFRRDLLATLLAILPVSVVRSVVEGAAALLDDAVPGGAETDEKSEGEGADENDEESDDDTETGDAATDDPDGTDPSVRTAVVDRIEGDVVVLLFEDGSGIETVPAAVLPAAAREEGIVLRVPRGDSLALATVDRAATARRRRAAGDRFDDLAEPAPDSGGSENATGT